MSGTGGVVVMILGAALIIMGVRGTLTKTINALLGR